MLRYHACMRKQLLEVLQQHREAVSSRPAEPRTMQQAELERCLEHCVAPAGLAAEHLTLAEMRGPLQVQVLQLPGQPFLLVRPLPPQQMHQRPPCPVPAGLLQVALPALRLRRVLQAGFRLLQVLMMGLLVAVQRLAKPPQCHLAPCQFLQLPGHCWEGAGPGASVQVQRPWRPSRVLPLQLRRWPAAALPVVWLQLPDLCRLSSQNSP